MFRVALCLALASFVFDASWAKAPVVEDIEKWVNDRPYSLVLFTSGDCSECRKIEKSWDDLFEIFKGVVSFAVMDVVSMGAIPAQYRPSKFPSIKVFHPDAKSPEDYTKGTTVEAIVQYTLSLVEKSVKARSKAMGYTEKSTHVVSIGDGNFTKLVQNSEDHWLVEFFAPWCGHCKSLAPAWKEAAATLQGRVKLAAVDATVHSQLASRFNVQGFPTIKFFPAHSADLDKAVVDYNGGRSTRDIVNWAEVKLRSLKPPPEFFQATSKSQLESKCLIKNLCVLVFFPNRLDSSAKEWNGYLDTMKDVIKTHKDNNWGWSWIEGGTNEKLESVVGVGDYGYPALVILNHSKKMYSPLKGAFTSVGIKDFISILNTRAVTTAVLPDQLPDISETKQWDGKDFEKSDL